MCVGEDVAVLGHDEAGAESLAALRLAKEVRAGVGEVRLDHDDAAGEALVDLLRREALAARRVGGGQSRRCLHDRLFGLPEVEYQHQDEHDERRADRAAAQAQEEPSHLDHRLPFVLVAALRWLAWPRLLGRVMLKPLAAMWSWARPAPASRQ